MFQMVLRAGYAALVLCMLGGELAIAQTTNGIPIVRRTHRYSGRVQLLGGQAAEVPAPPPSDDDLPIPGQNNAKIQEDLKSKGTMLRANLPTRRPDLRKDKHKDDDPNKSLFVIDATTTNKADPEIKKWGWLAEESDVSRQRLESYKKPNPEQEAWTNSLAGNTRTNETKRVETGSLKANSFQPLAATHTSTANVERVVEDRVARDAGKRQQDEARDRAAQKEGMHLADKRDGPALFTATNETLGLARSRKDDAQSDTSMEADFSQTRKMLAEITSRYQLGLTMADILRQPAKPPADTANTKSGTTRIAMDNDGTPGHYETRRPATFGDSAPGMATAAKAPTPPPNSSPTWIKSPSGMAPQAVSASAMVEGPKIPKASDMSSANRLAPSPQPSSMPVSNPVMPASSPGSITPSFSPSGAYTPGSLTPSFTPTTPYKKLFDTPSSR